MSTYFKEDFSAEHRENENLFTKASNYIQALNDKLQFFKKERWIAVGFIIFFYIIRLIMTGGIIK